jgi:ABC-type enterobactin transport system permease subunit
MAMESAATIDFSNPFVIGLTAGVLAYTFLEISKPRVLTRYRHVTSFTVGGLVTAATIVALSWRSAAA